MFSQTDVAIRTSHRSLLISRLKRGQLYEDSPRVHEALKIWEEVIVESSVGVNEARDELSSEISSEKARLASHSEKSSRSTIAEVEQTIKSNQDQSTDDFENSVLEGQDG